jgi:hypothetical protein
MKTFQTLYTEFQTITKDTSASNLAFGKKLINDTQSSICQMGNFTFLDDEMYSASVASQQSYRLPHNFLPNSLISCYVTQGGNKYYPKEIISQKDFDVIASDSSTSSYPEFFTIYGDYINFYPLPSDTSWGIYAKYRQMCKEMSADDYTTGSVTATYNSRKITGLGTTFTSDMVGRHIRLPDGIWYKIQSFSSTTELFAYKTYEGITTSGYSYVLGDCPIIPDGFQELLIYKPLEHYFMMTGEESRATFYKNLYDIGLRDLKSRYLSRSSTQVFTVGDSERVNPNDYPTNLS